MNTRIGAARLAKSIYAKLSPESQQFVTEPMIAAAIRDKAAPEIFFYNLANEAMERRVDGVNAECV